MNGLRVAGSPFHVFVKIPPTQLGRPAIAKAYSGLEGYNLAFTANQEFVFPERFGDVLILDKAGNRLRSIKKSEHGFQHIFGVAVDNEDNIYVTDDGSATIFKFDKEGRKIKDIKPSVDNFLPKGIAVPGDNIVVADRKNCQLVIFSRDLDFEKTVDLGGGRPVGITCDLERRIYVCDIDGQNVFKS